MPLLSEHPPSTTAPGYGVLGIGMYLPDRIVTNAEISVESGAAEEWIESKTGIVARHRAGSCDSTANMGAEAGRQALKDARERGLSKTIVDAPDMLIFATSTPDRQVPAPAFDVHARIGLPAIPALSIDGACAGFAQGLLTGYAYARGGLAETALVAGAHRSAVIIDPTERRIAPLFGDGAGAYMMGPVPAGYGIIGWEMRTDSSLTEVLRTERTTTAGSERAETVHMQGHALTETFATELPKMLSSALAQADLTIDDIDTLFVHQGNVRMVEALTALLGLPPEKVPTSGREVGNTACASLPIATAIEARRGAPRRGDIVALVTAGAGVNGAVVVLRWF